MNIFLRIRTKFLLAGVLIAVFSPALLAAPPEILSVRQTLPPELYQQIRAQMLPETTDTEEAEVYAGPEDVEHLLSLDTMELEVGYGLIPLVDRDQDGSLLGRIRAIRRQFASEIRN